MIMAPRRGETFQQFVDIATSMSLCPAVTQIYDDVVWNLHLQVFAKCFILTFFCLLLAFNLSRRT